MDNTPVEVGALEALHAKVNASTQVKVAKELGVTQPFLWMLLNGRKAIPKSILAKLGYERIVSIVPIRTDTPDAGAEGRMAK